MKNFTRFLILLILVFGSLLLQLCRPCKGGISVRNLTILKYTLESVWKKDNAGIIKYYETNAIPMAVSDTVFFVMRDSSKYAALYKNSNGSELMACDAGIITNYFSVWDSICVRTVYDFDASHKAGSSLEDVCLVGENVAYYDNNLSGIFKRASEFSGNFRKSTLSAFTLVLIKKPDAADVRFSCSFYDTETGDSTVSITENLKFY